LPGWSPNRSSDGWLPIRETRTARTLSGFQGLVSTSLRRVPFEERVDLVLPQRCRQCCRYLSSPCPGLQRHKPEALVPYWLSTPAMTLRCQPLVYAVFEPRAGRSKWPSLLPTSHALG